MNDFLDISKLFFINLHYNHIMSNLLNRLLAFIQNLQLEEAQSDEIYSQITMKNTLMARAIDKVKILLKFINKLGSMSSFDKIKWGLLIIGLIVIIYKWRSGGSGQKPPESPRKSSMDRQVSKQKMIKKNASLVSIKQY